MAIERIAAPSDGMNTAASPDYVPTKQARLLWNCLTGQGRTYLRGPITRKLSLGGALDMTPEIWTSGNKALIRTVATHRVADAAAGTVTSIAPARTMESSRHARVGDLVYGAVTPTLGAVRDLGAWNPAAGTIVASTNAPVDFIDLKQHLTRLFVLGGSVPGTSTPALPFNLYYSDRGGPPAGTLAQWQSDASGLVNQAIYAQQDTPIGLAKCGRWLAILMRQSIYLMTGDTEDSFAFRLAVSNVGCIDRESITESASGCYFMSDSGYMFFDGSSVQPVSNDILGDAGLMKSASLNVYRAAMVSNNYLMLNKCQVSTPLGATYLLNTATGAWTQVTSSLTSNNRLFMPIKLSDYVLAFDTQDLWDLTYLTKPEFTTTLGVDTDGVGTPVPIPLLITSRPAKLAGPSNQCQLARVMIDYVMTDPALTHSCEVRLYNPNTSAPIAQLSSLTPKASGLVRQRYQEAVFTETDSVAIQLSTVTGFTSATNIEIYDMWIEFEPGRSRPTI